MSHLRSCAEQVGTAQSERSLSPRMLQHLQSGAEVLIERWAKSAVNPAVRLLQDIFVGLVLSESAKGHVWQVSKDTTVTDKGEVACYCKQLDKPFTRLRLAETSLD